MKTILSLGTPVIFGDNAYEALAEYLTENNPSKLFILVDSNTQQLCLQLFLQQLKTTTTIEIIEIEPSEAHKNIETCTQVWHTLSELGADRKSLLINLGGGVITDLGGFVGSTFQRGIDYINVPTSLLAMVDASVGGKTGVDLGNIKNQIGIVNAAKMVLIDIDFLTTLPQNHLKSGLAEMLKHGLISSRAYWKKMSDLTKLSLADLEMLIYESIEIKNEIVTQDPYEKGMRKQLNFGHTLGHAIETYFLDNTNKKTLLHGEAIAIGMILAGYISYKQIGFSKASADEIKEVLSKTFSKVDFKKEDIPPILKLMKHDKKNSHGNINFVLLENIGKPIIDCSVPQETILEAFNFYAE